MPVFRTTDSKVLTGIVEGLTVQVGLNKESCPPNPEGGHVGKMEASFSE